jgi:hypothetical protein
MIDVCPSCDFEHELTDGGLCQRCRDELRFIVRPAAHREMYRRGLAAEAGLRAELERAGVVVISSLPDDNALWVCDMCNARIPVTGQDTLIPLMGSYALCIPCASTYPFWPDGWTQPRPRACRCGACQRPVLFALARVS